MADIIGGPINGLTDEERADTTGPSLALTTTGESLEQTAATTWRNLMPVDGFGRARGYDADNPNPPSDAEQQSWFPSHVTPFALSGTPTPVPLTAEEANAKNKAAGGTLTPFTAPVGPNAFDYMLQKNLADQKSQDVIQRSAAGIIASPARFAVGALVSLADPINDMAMMVPGLPAAWAARAIESAGGGILARTAVRAGAGAVQGAAGMAALQPLQAVQASQDHEDYSWGEALRQIAVGAAWGTGFGALHGVLSRSPETVDATMKAALARVMTDDPRGVDIQGLLDHADATDAADRLEAWQKRQQAIDAARPPDAAPDTTGRAVEISKARERMENAYEQERQLRGEVGQIPAVDEATQARLDAVQQELDRVIPSARRAELEQEREMLTGGQAAPDVALETARSQAQASGLTAAADRARATAQAAEEAIVNLRAQEVKEQAAAEAARTSSDRSTRIQQLKLDSREQVLQSLMEKEIRRFAYRSGVDLQPGEAEAAAREIRTAQPGEVRDTMAAHLNAIARRSDAFPVRDALERGTAPPPANNGPTAALRAEAHGAAKDMATRAMDTTDPELVRAARANAATIEQAPKLEGVVSKDTTEVSQMLADKKAEYDSHVAAGRIVESPTLADEGKAETEFGEGAKAYAATCGFGA